MTQDTVKLRRQAQQALCRRVPSAVLSGPAQAAAAYKQNAAVLARFVGGAGRASDAQMALHQLEAAQGVRR